MITGRCNGLLVTAAILLLPLSLQASAPPVGGGFTDAGLTGEYFANTSLSGTPAFTRHDVRINHDWRERSGFAGLPVGGARGPGMRDFPTDDFSIRWTGQLRARFGETYTFHITGEDGVRFRIRPQGGSWTALVDSLGVAAVRDVDYAMTADGLYDIEFSYIDRASTGASRAILEWSSASTPREVIEPLSIAQISNYLGMVFPYGAAYADLVLNSGSDWKDPNGNLFGSASLAQDTNGWPMVTNAALEIANAGYYNGTYRFRFHGRADVSFSSNGRLRTISAGGTTYGNTLPKGAGYDPVSNATEATVVFTGSGTQGNFWFIIKNAERSPGGAPGITDLEFMSPIAEGSSEPHAYGELAMRQSRTTFANFIMQRHQAPGLGHQGEHQWSDRRPATHRLLSDPEFQILQANEQGHDLYFNYPVSWETNAMLRFAQTVRYGSDGVNPYDHEVANPVFPPLNPNLRIYVEHANELPWAVYPRWVWDELHAKAVANHVEWQVVNYDGKGLNAGKNLGSDTSDGALSSTAMFRYHVLRMKQMSDALREVYADQPNAIGDRARVLCFGQYGGDFGMPQFLDDYFNNGTGTHVADPHPPRYFLWGAGGAIYYGTANTFGRMAIEPVVNGGFATPALADGTTVLRPDNAIWTFTGNGGIGNVVLPRNALSVTTGTVAATPPANVWAGCKFTVGVQDIFVYQLGRMKLTNNIQAHDLQIYDQNGKSLEARSWEGFSASVDFSKVGTVGTFEYVWPRITTGGGYGYMKSVVPMRLRAGQVYYLVSSESSASGADTFLGADTTAIAPTGITVNAAVIGTDGKIWTETPGTRTFGPVNFQFTTGQLATAEGVIGVPPDLSTGAQTEKSFNTAFPTATQCAFLSSNATMRQTITIPEAGQYWITWVMGRDQVQAELPVRVKVDGVVRAEMAPKYAWTLWYHSTEVFQFTSGPHEILFEGTGTNGTVYIDEVRMGRDVDFFGGTSATNFPGGGNAYGQNPATGYYRTAQNECDIALHWGLVPCTYEGGWAVQGDFDHYGMTAWRDLRFGSPLIDAELTKRGQRNAVDVWCRKGGFIYAYFYAVQEKIWDTNAPLLQGVREMNQQWIRTPDIGQSVPGVLTSATAHDTDPKLVVNEWKDWVVNVGKTGAYRVWLYGTGGLVRLAADDQVLAEGDIDVGLTGIAFPAKGLHDIKVRAYEAATIDHLLVELLPATVPVAPSTLHAATKDTATIDLSWADNADDEDGFKIERLTGSGVFVQIATLGANATNYTDTGLSGDTVYIYRVRAYNIVGDSAYTGEVSTGTPAPSIPATPSALHATAATPFFVDLSWTDNSHNEDGFKIERRTGANAFLLIGTVGSDVTTYRDAGLTPNTTYTYRVRSSCGSLNSAYSGEASVTTPVRPTPIVEEHFTDRNGTGSIGVNSWPVGSITTGLNYPGIVSANGALTGAGNYYCGTTFNGTGLGNGTFWFSAIVKNTVTDDRILFFSAAGGASSTGAGVSFTSTGAQAFLGGWLTGNTVNFTSASTNNLIVGKIMLSSTGPDTVILWVNPTDLSDESSLASSSLGTSILTTNGTINASTTSTIYPRQQGTSTVFDEIRLGTNLSSVAPVSGGVSVSGLPVITTQPRNQTVNKGDNVIFNVVAASDTPLFYQWKKNGVNVGGDSAILAFNKVQTNSAGTYTVVVSNSAGSVVSSAATLTVNPSNNNPYIAWAARHNLTEGPTGDDDGDGVSNFLEYAMRGNPTNADDTGYFQYRIVRIGGTNWFEYVYAGRPTLGDGMTYYLELTTNLVSGVWTNSGYIRCPAVTIDADFTAVTNRIDMSAGKDRFIRLIVK